MLTNPEKWKLSETNTEILQKLITRKRGTGVSLNTINTYVNKCVSWMRELGIDDIRNATADDILQVYFARQERVSDNQYSPSTLDGDVVALKQLMQYLHPDEPVGNYVPMKRRKTRNTLESTDYLKSTDVKHMKEYAQSAGDIRGVALIMLCFGTGARISEILDANIGDVEIKFHNAVLTVDGKTGRRKIPFVVGMPELIAWLNSHPCRDSEGNPDKTAPLFVTYNTRGRGVQRLSRKRVEAYFQAVGEAVGIPANVKCNPHAFRHLLATIMAKKLTAKEMNLLFGWSQSSTTSLTYIHTSQEDLETNILEINGVHNEEPNEREIDWVLQCPSCKMVLPAGSRWCTRCHTILDPVLAVKIEGLESDVQLESALENYLKQGKDGR